MMVVWEEAFDDAFVKEIHSILHKYNKSEQSLLKIKQALAEHKDYLYLEYNIDYAWLAYEIWKSYDK